MSSSMNPRRIAAIVLRQYYLMRTSPTRLVPLFAWAAIDIVLWGFIARYLNGVTAGGPNFTFTLLGAVLLWDFFTRVMHGITTAFLEDVWSRNFLNVFATPMRVSEYVSGLVLTSIATSLVGLAVMLALATGVFGLSFFAYGAAAVPFVLVLFLSHGRILLEGDPRALPREHGVDSLEALFIALAREPLHAEAAR